MSRAEGHCGLSTVSQLVASGHDRESRVMEVSVRSDYLVMMGIISFEVSCLFQPSGSGTSRED